MTFERILENKDWNWDYEGIYVHPHIPMKKLTGAIDSYAPNVSPNEILVLIDDTVFGGAREGMIVTRDAIYSKQKFESPHALRWPDIKDISPLSNARIEVNGQVFFDANIVEHIPILTLAARLSGCLSQAAERKESRERGRPKAEVEPPAIKKLRRLHNIALSRFRRDLEEAHGDVNDLGLDELIDAHFELLSEVAPQINERANKESPDDWSQPRIDAEMANAVLMAFILFHCTSFTTLSPVVRADLGDMYFFFAGAHMIYRDAFLAEIEGVFGFPPDRDQESLEILALVFMGRDGESEVQLKISREEALAKMTEFLGVTRKQVSDLNSKFQATLSGWWQNLAEQILDDADDEGQDDEEDFESSGGSGRDGTSAHSTSHAETLGVRPGASMAEIDLAYRGRRSQYHPDRYASEGEAAVRWATERMKEVNAAYEALKAR